MSGVSRRISGARAGFQAVVWPSELLTRARRLARGAEPAPDRVLQRAIEEECALPGCPTCRLLARRELRGLEALLWEQVTDPWTHRRLLASRGFCFEHTWALIPAGRLVHSHHGVAIVLHRLLCDFLAQASRGVQTAQRWLRPNTSCPACEWNHATEHAVLGALAWLSQQEPLLLADSPAVLCHPHAVLLVEHLAPGRRAAVERVLCERLERAFRHGTAEERLSLLVGRRPPELPAPVASCPACTSERLSLLDDGWWRRSRLHAWVAWLDAPDRLAREFDASDLHAPDQPSRRASVSAPATGIVPLCLGHLRQLIISPGSLEGLRAALDDLRRLATDLEVFIASADYRFTGELTPDQRRSWREAVARFAGEVPGAGLHDELPRPPGRWRQGAYRSVRIRT